jgi:hypothetical protein
LLLAAVRLVTEAGTTTPAGTRTTKPLSPGETALPTLVLQGQTQRHTQAEVWSAGRELQQQQLLMQRDP